MRSRRGDEPETYYLTCPVCGALPGTSCLEDYQERDRVHPSRKLSVTERNRRAADGWQPPELTERRTREHRAGDARAPQRRLSRLLAEYPAPATEPRLAPGSAREPALPAPAPPCGRDAPAQWAGTPMLGTDESARALLAAYLGGFPEHAAVPRWQLRDAATAWWPVLGESPLGLTPARRLRQRAEGRSGSSKGRHSSHHLASHLKSLEDLGLIRRDHARDAVIVTSPAGLRRLAEARKRPVARTPAPPATGSDQRAGQRRVTVAGFRDEHPVQSGRR